MQQIKITLKPGKQHLELHEFLSITNIAKTGGQAKLIIRSGELLLNNKVESRKRKKLSTGDIISYQKVDYEVLIT